MKELKVKVEFLNGQIKPQIEFGPYDSSDSIIKAIVSAMDYIVLQRLYNDKRIEVIEETKDLAILIYRYN